MTRGVPSKVSSDGTFGFEEFARLVNPARIDVAFMKYLPKTHDYVGTNIFRPAAVKKITRERPFAPNAKSTIAIKQSSTPLVGGDPANKEAKRSAGEGGDLVGSLGHEVVDGGMTLRMGVSSPKTKKGRYLYEILHNGATITAKPENRAALFAKLRASLGKRGFEQWKLQLPPTPKAVWHIPARHFLTDIFTDKAWLAEAIQPYKDLVRLVMLEDAKTHGT